MSFGLDDARLMVGGTVSELDVADCGYFKAAPYVGVLAMLLIVGT